MKAHLDISHNGNLGDEGRVVMRFDEDSIAHLMSILTDLYSDPQLACVREYSTNAMDSHVAAGQTRPIEIELPTALRPTFIVRDFGLGMSIDTITEQFSKYGWSSKRETDDQTGMLGLGCKAGLSYTSQFTMISNYNGLRITVLVTRTPSGAGALQVVDTVPTDEPNGVEVRIPTSPLSFGQKARDFFRFWDPGTVLIDGEQPSCIWTDESVYKLDEDVAVIPARSSWIVMGNVAYPVDTSKIVGNNGGETGIVARVPIGTVNFTPSREALHFTKRTNETLATLGAFVKDALPRKISAALASEPNAYAARMKRDKYARFGSLLGVDRYHRNWGKLLHYRGEVIPSQLFFDEERTLLTNITPVSWGRDSSERHSHLGFDRLEHVKLIVVGGRAGHLPAPLKAKARQWALDNKLEMTGMMLFCPAEPDAKWLNPKTTVVHIDKIRAVDLRDKSLPIKDATGRTWFTVLNSDGGLVNFDTPGVNIEANPPLCWIEAGEGKCSSFKDSCAQVAGVYRVANVTLRARDRFAREYPDVPHFVEWFPKFLAERAASFSPIDVYLLGDGKRKYDSNGIWPHDLLGDEIDARRLDDPDLRWLAALRKEIKRHRGSASRTDQWHFQVPRVALWLEVAVPTLPPSGLLDKINVLWDRYPLAWVISDYVRETRYRSRDGAPKPKHVYQYLNDTYLLRQGMNLHPVTY